MATAEELLSRGSSSSNILVIDQDLRRIVIPSSVTNIGVEFDDDVLRLPFLMPATYCGIDLSTFRIRINYLNANNEPDVYEVDDAVLRADDKISFSWLVGRHALAHKGLVTFNVCLRDIGSNEEVVREFNTTIATLPVLEGLETGEAAIQYFNDIFEQWRVKLFGEGESAVAAIETATDTSLKQIASARDDTVAAIPADYTAAVNTADEAVRTKADAIVRTVRGRNITIADSSEDPVRGLRLFGASTQETLTGKNQVNLSTFEFDGSTTYNHRHNATYSEELHNLYQFLSNNTGKSIVLSMTRVGTKSGVEIGTIILFDANDNPLCTIVPNVPHTIVDLPRECNYAYIYGSHNGASVHNIQVEFGTEATDYEPYCGGVPAPNPEHPMPIVSVEGAATTVGSTIVKYNMGAADQYLYGLPVNSGGNYTDESGQQWICDEIDYARGVYIQRIASKILDESCGYEPCVDAPVSNTGTYTVSFNDIMFNQDGCILADRLCCYPAADFKVRADDGIYRNPANSSQINVRLSHERATSMTSFVDFMRDHPITVLAPLKTPVETPISDVDMLTSFKAAKTVYPNTSVKNTGGAYMEVSYNADLQTYIDNHVGSGVDIQNVVDEDGKHHVTINTAVRGS